MAERSSISASAVPHGITAGSLPAVAEPLLLHLVRLMSVIESQVCALEVLDQQMPKLNTLLEENVLELSNSFCLLATKAQQQSQHLEDMQKILDSSTSSDANTEAMRAILSQTTTNNDEIMGAVSRAIVGMQFQDRVSQNIVIAKNILGEIVSYLKSAIHEAKLDLSKDEYLGEGRSVTLDADFARTMIGYLTLGELKHRFLQHLVENGYIQSPQELGYSDKDTLVGSDTNTDDDNIELF